MVHRSGGAERARPCLLCRRLNKICHTCRKSPAGGLFTVLVNTRTGRRRHLCEACAEDFKLSRTPEGRAQLEERRREERQRKAQEWSAKLVRAKRDKRMKGGSG